MRRLAGLFTLACFVAGGCTPSEARLPPDEDLDTLTAAIARRGHGDLPLAQEAEIPEDDTALRTVANIAAKAGVVSLAVVGVGGLLFLAMLGKGNLSGLSVNGGST